MDKKQLKVIFEDQNRFDLIRVLLNELKIPFEEIIDTTITKPEQQEIPKSEKLEEKFIDCNKKHEKINPKLPIKIAKAAVPFVIASTTVAEILESISKKQKKYFETGLLRDIAPMIYKDVANELHKDISTVARVVGDREYLLKGEICYYKDLFREGRLTTKDGRGVTQYEFFDEIINIIQNENKYKPYSDDDIKAILQTKGYGIERRTVCKYRKDFLDISNSHERKIF